MESYEKPPQLQDPQVFINFRGAELRQSFIGQLKKALNRDGVNVFVDGEELTRGDPVNLIFKGIEESQIALVIFSKRYAESSWCLDELVKIKERAVEGKLVVIPIFYRLNPSEMKRLDGDFGLNLWNCVKRTSQFDKLEKWKEALDFVSQKMGMVLYENNSNEITSIAHIIDRVKSELFRPSLDSKETDCVQTEVRFPKKLRKDDSFIDEANSDATSNIQNLENKRFDLVNDEEKQGKISESSDMVTSDEHPKQHQVYISFRGADMRYFVAELEKALKSKGVYVYSDICIEKGEHISNLFKLIEKSRIALVIFSNSYSESSWCLNELVKIKKCMGLGKLLIIPIFYKVDPSDVKLLKGDFGVKFWNSWRIDRDNDIIKWKEALRSVASIKGIYWKEHCVDREVITLIVKDVVERISLLEKETNKLPLGKGEKHENHSRHQLFGMEQRLEQLEKKLEFDCMTTRIIGVAGIPGIGKTTLASLAHQKWSSSFIRCAPLFGMRSKNCKPKWLRKTLLEILLLGKVAGISEKTTHESLIVELLKTKIFVVLDDVSDKKQLEFLLSDLNWIKKGSKIIITTCDKSLLKGFADDIYMVPELNDREAFQLFSYHAFNDQTHSPTGNVLKLCRTFVDYAHGNPLALNLLGRELYGRDMADWEHKLATVPKMLQAVWRFSTDQLNERQKDVFLDIMCFFKSEDEYYVRSLLDSGDPNSIDTASEVRDLANKFLITISAGRVEMNDMLCMYDKDLSYTRWLRLSNYTDIINKLKKIKNSEAYNIRGIFLNLSKLTKSIYLNELTFINMHNLRYLEIYDSSWLGNCEVECKLCFPNGLKFPLKAVRYLHWVKFPLKELPPDFRPDKLVDLRLPYSKINRVWEGIKDVPQLKWVDLNHSSELLHLSALSKAVNLQRLNLEGCTSLKELSVEIQGMKSLVFLNLRGCICLRSLPKMNLTSLHTLVLSGCKNLKKFQLISESIEVLHLDGTAIEELPLAIQRLQRLVVLNLKNCKMLECLPNCLRELKALEELILSGCSKLNNLSDIRESMKHLQSLLIDRIGAKDMPNISSITTSKGQTSADMVLQGPSGWPEGVDGVFSLRRLSLSGNDFVSLQTDIWNLYNLNWLDVKDCRMLRSIPMLPPRLQYFDASGCDSLQRVENPLALPVLSGQIHATFNFSNCNELDQDAKESIISYTRWKSQLVLDSVAQYDAGSVLEGFIGTCFPGSEVPAWFSHKISGSVLKPKLLPHCGNRLTGIALCAVIIVPLNYEQRNHFFLKCNCVFYNEGKSLIRFSHTIGSWSKPSNTAGEVERSHVFIGYTSMLVNKKHEDGEICSHTESSFEFQVTDGTEVLEGCEVLECGFSFVYGTDERENIGSYTKTVVIPDRIENIPSEEKSYGNSTSHEGIHYASYSGDGKFSSEEKSVTPNLQKFFENKSIDLRDAAKTDWQHERRRARQETNMTRREVWTLCIDQLNDRQKDLFLDIVYFFKSEDEYFVRSLLDPGNPEAVSELRDLADKFLISISCGRVEMPDQVYTLGKDLGFVSQHRLCNYKEIINKLMQTEPQEDNDVRGIFLDMAEIKESITLECTTFTNICNLLYLKIYDSRCPLQFKDDCNLYLPDGLDFHLEEVRYLHWVKFPLEELPIDFRPEKLVDLRLPYSNIKCIWEIVKDTPCLKWVDLSNSSKLLDLSALSKAENLQRLNLEGCTSLKELPVEIQNMKSLNYLNLRGCIGLRFLPKMNLISLKTLILSDCSNLKVFQLISVSVEFLHLDGTAIKELPPTILSLERLVVLNLKNCKMLECLPDCLGNLRFLDELILSGCSRLKNFPDVRHSLKHLQILLLDGTSSSEMPSISLFTGSEGSASADISLQPFGSYSTMREGPGGINGVSLLRRLCLSGNDFVSLQPDIAKLYNLKWLDVKQCKNLRSVPMLPPRLQYFDAHGCESLERVANPLAFPVLPEQINATFSFSNCNKLDRDAKDNIMSYAQWRSQLVRHELTRYNGGFAFEASIRTCFPGWEVPAWFSHRTSGSVLEAELLPQRCVNKFTGIALCAVLEFHGNHDPRKRVLVKCNCEIKNENGSSIQFCCTVGGWSTPSNASQKIESSHVFICYTRKSNINIQGEENDKEGCSHTQSSFEFQVTDGTEVLEGCEVLKCGFSFLYETDELQVEPGVRRAPLEEKYYMAYSKDSEFSSVKGDTETVERTQGELPNKMTAHGLASTPQLPITKSLDPLSMKPHLVSATHDPVVATSSQAGLLQSQSWVLVSFHGTKIGSTFVRNLVRTLENARLKVFIDNGKGIGSKLEQLNKKKEESNIALVIFSKSYPESNFCLDDLVMMSKLAEEGKLLVIPVFYNVRVIDVMYLKGGFGRRFKEMSERNKDNPKKVLKWETSLKSIVKKSGIHSEFYSKEARLVEATVKAVLRGNGGNPNPLGEGNSGRFESFVVSFILVLFVATSGSTGTFLVGLLVFLLFAFSQSATQTTR